MTLKHCNGCGEDKELSEFYIHKTGKLAGKLYSLCKECNRRQALVWRNAHLEKAIENCNNWKKANPEKICAWRKTNPERLREYARENAYRHGSKPASENKSCALYLGCVVAETVLSHEFPGFKRMPNGNPGYDYDCPKGFKIDVKSACRQHSDTRHDSWHFSIKKNAVADYFLCIAFDDRKTLNPEYVWLIPGNVVNKKTNLCITDLPELISKWSQYERSLKTVLICCNKIRGKKDIE